MPSAPSSMRSNFDIFAISSAGARAYYEQGLNYLHGYVWIEAARSFHEALRLDPALAMAHLGLSRVHSGIDAPDEARRALEKAEALSEKASPRERRRTERKRHCGERARRIQHAAILR